MGTCGPVWCVWGGGGSEGQVDISGVWETCRSGFLIGETLLPPHSQTSAALAQSPCHLPEGSNGSQKCSHTNTQASFGHHPPTCAGSWLPAKTRMEPPPCPGQWSVWYHTWGPDVFSECIPGKPLKLSLYFGAKTQHLRILSYKSQHCECKSGVPHTLWSPSLSAVPSISAHPTPPQDRQSLWAGSSLTLAFLLCRLCPWWAQSCWCNLMCPATGHRPMLHVHCQRS